VLPQRRLATDLDLGLELDTERGWRGFFLGPWREAWSSVAHLRLWWVVMRRGERGDEGVTAGGDGTILATRVVTTTLEVIDAMDLQPLGPEKKPRSVVAGRTLRETNMTCGDDGVSVQRRSEDTRGGSSK
jgi:hypothetical protein